MSQFEPSMFDERQLDSSGPCDSCGFPPSWWDPDTSSYLCSTCYEEGDDQWHTSTPSPGHQGHSFSSMSVPVQAANIPSVTEIKRLTPTPPF